MFSWQRLVHTAALGPGPSPRLGTIPAPCPPQGGGARAPPGGRCPPPPAAAPWWPGPAAESRAEIPEDEGEEEEQTEEAEAQALQRPLGPHGQVSPAAHPRRPEPQGGTGYTGTGDDGDLFEMLVLCQQLKASDSSCCSQR